MNYNQGFMTFGVNAKIKRKTFLNLEAIIDAIKKDIDGKGRLIIKSCLEYTILGYTKRYRNWINNDWKKSNGKPVRNRNVFEMGLSLTEERPGSVEIKLIEKQRTTEINLAHHMAQLTLDEKKK
ncbi:hypothetical protein K501DRAFT_270363 [Backusella circina FSU 941]|nr:hypothetical protein K501DRAFT_270363 [Backusella circina FSU 941]